MADVGRDELVGLKSMLGGNLGGLCPTGNCIVDFWAFSRITCWDPSLATIVETLLVVEMLFFGVVLVCFLSSDILSVFVKRKGGHILNENGTTLVN